MTRVASAPGKVVVSGEYAVLRGAPAVVMAVDRRAWVRVSPADGDLHRLSLPGLCAGELEFRVDGAGKVSIRDGQSPPIDLALLGQVWSTLAVRPGGALRLEIDTRSFFHETRTLKLGLGSSAAVAVALTAALLPDASQPRELAAAALAAHRGWQGGGGSGLDVAAALHGGVFAFRVSAGTEIEPLRWPEGLHRALLWSGRPSGTAGRLATLRESSRTRSVREGIARLARAAEEALSSWRLNDAGAALEAISRYLGALQRFDVHAGLGIFDAGHRELVDAAAGKQVVYKPCGAGGGDVGIALALDEGALGRFVAAAEARGFQRLHVAVDPRGAGDRQ